MQLSIRNVSRNFSDKLAVSNFNCELNEGVYGLLGPNGSGKSTLLKMIAGILKPTAGKIFVDNKEIYEMDEKYRSLLGYLPQSIGVYRDFKAKDFLLYFAALKGIEGRDLFKCVKEMLELVGLDKELNTKVGKFSGGMKKRLGIAIALLNDPKIIILDEPTAALDPNERMRFRNIISEISKDKIIILSTHIVSDIEYISKEIIIMKSGELIRKDTSENILNELKGKVWEYITNDSMLGEIKGNYKISNILRIKNGVSLRMISDKKPFETAKNITPNLDDIYLYYFGEESSK